MELMPPPPPHQKNHLMWVSFYKTPDETINKVRTWRDRHTYFENKKILFVFMIFDIYQPNTRAWGEGDNAEVSSYYKVDNHPLNVVTNQSMANIKDGSGGRSNPTVAWPIVLKPGMSSYVIPSARRDCCGSSPLRIPHRRTGERGTSGRTSSLLSKFSCSNARYARYQ